MTIIKMHISNVKLPLYPPCEVKYGLQNRVSTATLRGTDYAEKVVKWGTVLGASDVKYMPRTYVKGLVLAGLVARLDEFPLEKEAKNQGLA